MDTNQKIALALLTGRVITVLFICLTIKLQWELVHSKLYPELQWYRKMLLGLTLALLIGNFVPILIDSEGIAHKGSFGLLLAYVFSNNLTAMLAAIITWFVYWYSRNK